MKPESAGLLMFRRGKAGLEVLLAHPGGPFWAKKDAGAWSIVKGESDDGEDLLDCAQREFFEETALRPSGPFLPLGLVRQKSGKVVHGWAFAGDCDPKTIVCNRIEIEWPPRSGRRIEIPEIDRAEFFPLADAREKLNPAQVPFLDRLRVLVGK